MATRRSRGYLANATVGGLTLREAAQKSKTHYAIRDPQSGAITGWRKKRTKNSKKASSGGTGG